MEILGNKTVICQLKLALQKPLPSLLREYFLLLFLFFSFLLLLLGFFRPPSPSRPPPEPTTFTSCLSTTVSPSSQHQKSKETAAAAAKNNSRSRSSSIDGTAKFWSLPEPIPMLYSCDFRLFGKLSLSTTVLQLESLRSVSGSSRNEG